LSLRLYQSRQPPTIQASPPLTMLLECEAQVSGTTRFKVNNLLQIYVL